SLTWSAADGTSPLEKGFNSRPRGLLRGNDLPLACSAAADGSPLGTSPLEKGFNSRPRVLLRGNDLPLACSAAADGSPLGKRFVEVISMSSPCVNSSPSIRKTCRLAARPRCRAALPWPARIQDAARPRARRTRLATSRDARDHLVTRLHAREDLCIDPVADARLHGHRADLPVAHHADLAIGNGRVGHQ